MLTSDRPVSGDYVLGPLVEKEICRRSLFGLFPLDPILSPADALDELAGDGALVRVSIEERVHRVALQSRRCFRLRGHRVEGSASVAAAQQPAAQPPVAHPPVAQPPGSPPSVAQPPAPTPSASIDEVQGWPSIPFGTKLSFEHRVREVYRGVSYVDANDASEFLGLSVSDAQVAFVDDVAVSLRLRTSADSLEILEALWGPATVQGATMTWQGRSVRAELKGRKLSIERL